MVLSATAIAILLGIAARAALTGIKATGVEKIKEENAKKEFENELKNRFGDLSNADIDALMNEYKNDSFNLTNPSTWFDNWGSGKYDRDSLLEDYNDYLSWKDQIGDLPEYVDYDALANQANKAIDSENKELLQLFDETFNRNNNALQNELDYNNQIYNDYVGQIMSNQAQSQNMLQGSVRSELERAQRNAIDRGASAAMRLVSNINTRLGLQNQAASQALETSNNLAQMLLNQRQAASQLRGDYIANQNQYASDKASLISGTAERKANYRNSLYNEQEYLYDQKLNQWEDKLSGYSNGNIFGDVHRNKALRDKSSASKYGL